MYRSENRLILSATDVVASVACPRLTGLDLAAIGSGTSRPELHDPMLEVLTSRGLEHEEEYLGRLRDEGLGVVEITLGDRSPEGLRRAHVETAGAMAAGVDVVYQATFFDESGDVTWRGHADFLRRTGAGDALRYEPEDTKLARHVSPGAVLQLCNYADHVATAQGSTCDEVHVVLGGKDRVSLRLADFAAYYRMSKAQLLEQVRDGAPESYPLPIDHCPICRWRSECSARRLADDHLTLVAGLSTRQATRLEAVGVPTLTALAKSDAGLRVPRVAATTLENLRNQARLQLEARLRPGEPPPYELRPPPGQDAGLEALPPPSPGDVFFDIESDPYAGDGGLEYLFGLGWIDDGEFRFRPYWAHSPEEERAAFEAVVDFFAERRRRHPDMHVYHYAPYEPSALGRLMGRHGTRESEVDDLFKGRLLVDLYRVVRQGMTVGSYSYSIKKLEPLYMERRDAEILDAGSSIVEYERWLHTGDQQILDDLEEYNRDDCRSTMLLRDWLEERRLEAEAQFGVELTRPSERRAGSEETDDSDEALVATRLTEGMDTAPTWEQPEAAATWLLAQLLHWHRREAKPEWWAYFHRVLECDDEDLLEDSEAISGLTYDDVVGTDKQSLIHRYRFDRDQDYKIGFGTQVVDPTTERLKVQSEERRPGPGTVWAIDHTAGTIDLKRSAKSKAPHPTALIPSGPIPTTGHRAALLELGRSVLDRGIDADGPCRAARDLLQRRPPRVRGTAAGAPLVTGAPGIAELTDIALRMDRTYLAVQGPPGTGKTYTAARSIVALLDAGKKVGITANSHAVITHLLDEVMKVTAKEGRHVRAAQKGENGSCSERDDVQQLGNDAIEAALADGELDLVAGTGWLFVREGMRGTLDHLLIDEAGQLSLANVVAISGAADNLILVGDPRQLAQPSKGSHPPGAGASGLEHVLAGAATVPADRGLFLETSWRMHPDVCAFTSEVSYQGRLHSQPHCDRQRIHGDDELAGAGLRWWPIGHETNRTSSTEEAEAIATIVDRLVGRTWTDDDGEHRTLGLEDILIVAPYNAQVGELLDALPDGARVGTVDKFQGREGAVAIVSLAASSAEDAPRGLEFLLSQNRMNVAVSRAKAMSIVVANPSLLGARCRTVDQMRLANGLCRYVELATSGGNADRRGVAEA